MNAHDVFSANLKRLREGKGLTQRCLGNLSGFSSTTIALMEAGGGVVTLEKLERLAKGLEVPPWRLLWKK
jgi:transcriptional regulator with XRE-family HTH domain